MENVQYKNYFWLLLDVLLVVAIVGAVFFGMPALNRYGDSLPAARVLSVSAEGKTAVSPDIAEVSFSVVSQGENPQMLADKNNDKMAAVVNNIKGNGVDAKDITTTNYDLQPNYSYDKNTGRSYIYNYTLTQTVFVKIRNLGNVAKVIGGVTPLGVNQIGSVSFRVEDSDKFLGDARKDAFKKAEAKAAEIAKASGVQLGRITNVNEYQNYPIPYYKTMGMGMGGAADIASLPSIEPGTQELKLNVSVTYSIK